MGEISIGMKRQENLLYNAMEKTDFEGMMRRYVLELKANDISEGFRYKDEKNQAIVLWISGGKIIFKPKAMPHPENVGITCYAMEGEVLTTDLKAARKAYEIGSRFNISWPLPPDDSGLYQPFESRHI
jgi:hypothetical protein